MLPSVTPAKDLVLPDCDPEVFNRGRIVIEYEDMASMELEGLVCQLRKKIKGKIDWHWQGGKGVIKTTGDVSKVLREIQAIR